MTEMMTLQTVSYEDFSIYSEVVEARHDNDAYRSAQHSYNRMYRKLRRFGNIPMSAVVDVSHVEARRAEAEYHEKNIYPNSEYGLGVGVRVLCNENWTERLIEDFVPNPTELGAPEVVRVEAADIDDYFYAGLILPNGAYKVTPPNRQRFQAHYEVELFSNARLGDDLIEYDGRPDGQYSSMNVLEVSDSSGMAWVYPDVAGLLGYTSSR